MSAAAIPDALRPRLGRFIRLLASDQPGEVVAAAAALRRTLAGVGADLNDLGDAIERPAAPAMVFRDAPRPSRPKRPAKSRKPQPTDVVLDATTCRRVGDALWRAMAGGRLSEWETEFAGSLAEQMRAGRGRLTERQGEALDRLLRRLGEAGL